MNSRPVKAWVGLVLSGLMLAMLPACSATTRVASAGNVPPSAAKKAALLMRSAQVALQRGDNVRAVNDAEAAVLLAPDNAGARASLGRAYLAAGRFQSADTAFADTLTLDPGHGRIAVTRALMQIALGQTDTALALLDRARGQAAEADIGLALALAGQGKDAILRLETAARLPGADARVRQNLALAYALDGRWNDAAATAAIDVPAEKMAERMQRWSQLAQRRDRPMVQIAMLLGTIPVADAGQPDMLALAAPRVTVPVEMAAADRAPPERVGAEVNASPEPAVTPVTEMDGRATAAILPRIKLAPPAMSTMKPLPLPAIPVGKPAAPSPARASRVMIASPPRPIMLAAHRTLSAIQGATGFVVQLGAFSSMRRTEAAWMRIAGQAHYLSAFTPVGSGFRAGNATLYRLSISGLATRADAARLCSRIKAGDGDCFVRAASGDRPIRWTMRDRDGVAA